MKNWLVLILSIIVLGGCATTEQNQEQRTITGYKEMEVRLGGTVQSYKGFVKDFQWDCYGLIEYRNGDIYSGEVSSISTGPRGGGWRGVQQGKGVLVKVEGEVLSGEWSDNKLISPVFIPSEDLQELSNYCVEKYSKNTVYWYPKEEFKQGLKDEANVWLGGAKKLGRVAGEAAQMVAEITLVSAVVVASIASSPEALEYQETKNQKKKEEEAYKKGRKDEYRKQIKKKQVQCSLNRNC